MKRLLRRLRCEVSAGRLVASAMVQLFRNRCYQAMALLGAAETTGARLAPPIGAMLLLPRTSGPVAASRRNAAKACPAAEQVRARFHARASSDLLHANLIVLKSYVGARERGVLLLKYSEIINAFPLVFDTEAIQRRYHLVFEPSTTGFMQPATLLLDPRLSVIGVETVEPASVRHYARLGFLPLNVSDGDWVDEEEFRPLTCIEKRYDFAMIANVIPLKRHTFVFDAIKRYWKGDIRFALVGSSWVGGGLAGAKALLRAHDLGAAADLHFDVAQADVNRILNESRCHVLASEREGANRACLEALFAGIPSLLPRGHVGFPHFRYDRSLVRLYGDGADLIRQIVDCRRAPSPQAISSAARKVAGSRVATDVVTVAMKQECLARGETWDRGLAHKVTRVHCCYHQPSQFDEYRADYAYIASVARDGFSYEPARAQQLLTR